VDRSSATYHSITVNDITVVITEFKPKPKKESAAKKKSKQPQSSAAKEGSNANGGATKADAASADDGASKTNNNAKSLDASSEASTKGELPEFDSPKEETGATSVPEAAAAAPLASLPTPVPPASQPVSASNGSKASS